MHVRCVLRGVEVPIGDFAAGGWRKVNLDAHNSGLDRFPEVLPAFLLLTHFATMHPDPDLDVLRFRISDIGSDCLPGVGPLFPSFINEVVLEPELASPVNPLPLLRFFRIAAGEPLPCGSAGLDPVRFLVGLRLVD